MMKKCILNPNIAIPMYIQLATDHIYSYMIYILQRQSSKQVENHSLSLSTVVLSTSGKIISIYEMKGDVGMSVHEKERKQEDAYTKTQTHS